MVDFIHILSKEMEVQPLWTASTLEVRNTLKKRKEEGMNKINIKKTHTSIHHIKSSIVSMMTNIEELAKKNLIKVNLEMNFTKAIKIHIKLLFNHGMLNKLLIL